MDSKRKNVEADFLGELAPMQSARFRGEMDRRGISIRWLGGSFLTGLASVFLMGGALFAALDGRQNLAIPAQAYEKDAEQELAYDAILKSARPSLQPISVPEDDNNIMMVSTISREGDQDVVKLKPFMHIFAPLAAVPKRDISYPKFDPLAVFSESGKAEPIEASQDQIYGEQIEGEISLKIEDYPFGNPKISLASRQNTSDIETFVRNSAPELSVGGTALTSIAFFDSARFSAEDTSFVSTPGLTITAENVSTISRSYKDEYDGVSYEERFARVRSELPIALVLEGEGLDQQEAIEFANAIASNLSSDNLLGEDRLRLAFEMNHGGLEKAEKLVRVSVYRGGRHLVSVTRKDSGNLSYALEPEPVPEQMPGKRPTPLLSASKLPNIYDAIYSAALGEGLPVDTASLLIRIFAFDVDFRTPISTQDNLELFMSLADGELTPTNEAEILYTGIKLGNLERRYYRFRDPETGLVDYYDETGKSAKQFLLREPVPNGKFRSPFGMRRHPITRVQKMHTGVDWSAPRGTPILAAGNGIVEKAGWAGGYGRQTILRHANGYKTSYSHQTGFAKGVKAGARVRQGQLIGFVGSTGLSTGPHLHYEVLVNGNKVNPMKIKLPSGKVFRGNELLAFEAERDRIDKLLRDRKEENQRLARN
ncbi:MAG: M23 family metallopeptidase [Salaquimonas sp.]